MMDQDEAMFGTEVKPKKKINLTKWFALGLGGVLGLSHVGMIGMISRKDGLPKLDIPVTPYTSGGLEAVVGYEGETPGGIGWYVSGGPTVTHTESTDEFGDVELIGYLGGSYDKFYGEISGVTTASDDIDFSAKAGVKFTF